MHTLTPTLTWTSTIAFTHTHMHTCTHTYCHTHTHILRHILTQIRTCDKCSPVLLTSRDAWDRAILFSVRTAHQGVWSVLGVNSRWRHPASTWRGTAAVGIVWCNAWKCLTYRCVSSSHVEAILIIQKREAMFGFELTCATAARFCIGWEYVALGSLLVYWSFIP